jgi:CubicO group peptidase (beta-lactamase class C family)
MMDKLIIALIGLLLTGCVSPTEDESGTFQELTNLVDQYAKNALRNGNINSLAIAIYKDSLTYEKYYGEIDKGIGNRPNDSTLYEIASVSKVFTGSLVAKAVVENKMSLDDDIRLYLDGDYENLEFDGQPVRIRHLVTHTLGFDMPKGMAVVYNRIFSGGYENEMIDYGIDDLLEELKSVELDTTPGAYYDYSNVGPELAAYILEQAYNKPYEELLDGFFERVGISNSHVYALGKYEAYLANGYDENNKPSALVRNPLFGAAGGLISTLPDLAKFMEYQLESNDALIKESAKYVLKDGEDDTGYFWDLGEAEKEGFYYSKSGSSNGVESVVLICPDSNYGMVMVMNNQADAAMNDWIGLYNRIEYDLIEYPRINLWSKLEADFEADFEATSKRYKQLRTDEDKYFSSSSYLNRIGYGYISKGKVQTSIKVFKLAISEDSVNADLYDSLGEACFIARDYQDSKKNYEKSLSLDPSNDNAKKYLDEIDELIRTE